MAESVSDDSQEEKPSEWKFTQWFRKMDNPEEGDSDFLSAVEFDKTGQFLATGDRSGHIVVLENDTSAAPPAPDGKPAIVHYKFYAEFTSHSPAFDYVRSQPVEEKINKIKWLPQTNDSLYMLTTNDRQIKLWKIHEKERKNLTSFNLDVPPSRYSISSGISMASVTPLNTQREKPIVKTLKIPKVIRGEKVKFPFLKKKYATDVHQFNIGSLDVSTDGETFLSGDNLRINLWNLAIADQSYNIVDMKPEDMTNLSEIITSLDYHPQNSHLFLYSSSLGNIRFCDLRERALVDQNARLYSVRRDATVGGDVDDDNKGFFDEMTQNVTDAKFSKTGDFIISRDYMSVKIWDVRSERKPLQVIYVHEYLRERMWDLYENDLFWDNFGLGISSKGDVVTGSYSNYFHILNLSDRKDTFVQASQPPLAVSSTSKTGQPRPSTYSENDNTLQKDGKKKGKGMGFGIFKRGKKKKKGGFGDGYPFNIEFESLEFDKKILECAWHPEEEAVAIAGQNNLYIYAK